MTDDETFSALVQEVVHLQAENFLLKQMVDNLENELDEAWRCRDGDDY